MANSNPGFVSCNWVSVFLVNFPAQEIENVAGDDVAILLQGEMARVKQMDFGVRHVIGKRQRAGAE